MKRLLSCSALLIAACGLIDDNSSSPTGPDESDSADTTHKMVHVPAGPFEMGSESGVSAESPVHTVELDGYYIDTYEVTNELYQAFVQATDREQPPYASDSRLNGAQQPVVGVWWFDAEAYCGWAGLRLPTEPYVPY